MLVARRREISLVRLVPTTLVAVRRRGRSRACSGAQDAVRLALELGLARPASRSSPSTIGHVRDTLQTARALGDVLRVLLVDLARRRGARRACCSTCRSRFLGIQGNIAQLGPIQGIFGTRNLLGFVAVLALITFLIEYRTQSVRAGVSVVLGRARGRPRGAQRLPHRARARRRRRRWPSARSRSCATRAPERRSALQWTLGGLVVVGLVDRLCGAASDHRAGSAPDRTSRCGSNLWNTMVDYPAHQARPGLGMVRPVEPGRVPVQRDQLPLAHEPRDRR